MQNRFRLFLIVIIGGNTQNYESYQNAGLGLAIAKEVIDHHDGIIWAESMETKGSSFYFTLPIYLGEKEKEGV